MIQTISESWSANHGMAQVGLQLREEPEKKVGRKYTKLPMTPRHDSPFPLVSEL